MGWVNETIPARHIAAFKQACGNRLITQWLSGLAGVLMTQASVQETTFTARLQTALLLEVSQPLSPRAFFDGH